jgi:hypothetical protein
MIPTLSRPIRALRAALLLPVLLALGAGTARAQLLSAGVGAGSGVGRHHGPEGDASHTHALGWVQVGVPMFPIAVRGDALVSGKGTGGGPLALSANAVFQLPLIPMITPYATAGWGTYGIGGDARTKGWSAGLGVKARVPGLPGFFGEVRRHERLGRDLATLGVMF